VVELEERLAVQALLAEEERKVGPPTEVELRAWYDAHRPELVQPERVRVVRVLAVVAAGATEKDRTSARRRAEELAARLRRGEDTAKVAAAADGAERFRGGDLGFLVRGRGGNSALEQAAFALSRPGEVSPVFADKEGYAAVRLVERQAQRDPSFEEARGEVANRLSPQRKRRVFDQLIERLRKDADVRLDAAERRG
jgi:peptidyl-prolyl cis-trans isomerase C